MKLLKIMVQCKTVYLSCTQSGPFLCDPVDYSCQALLSRDFPDKNTRVGLHFLL